MDKVVTVAVGTYEGGLLVYRVDLENSIHLRYFSSKDAQGSLKSILFCGRDIYTGGRDESVRIYNSAKKLQEGALQAQSGTVEKICKIEGFIFVSASDGTVTIYGRKDNTYYHTLKLHSKTILDFDVHRSGRLMVSYGGEGKIKLSDLASMAEVYHKNIKSYIDFIRFLPDDNLLFCKGNKLVMFNSEDNSEKELRELRSKVTWVEVHQHLVVVSDEQGHMYFGHYPELGFVVFQAYKDARVKSFRLFEEEALLVTISTEGFVTVWEVEFLLDKIKELQGQDLDLGDKVQNLYEFQIEARIISLDCKIDTKKKLQSDEAVVKVKPLGAKKHTTFIDSLIPDKKPRRAAQTGRKFDRIHPIQKLRKLAAVSKMIQHKRAKLHPEQPSALDSHD